MSYFYVFLTILFTVYGQIAIKWQMLKAGALPESFPDKVTFLLHLLLNPWIISAFITAFLAALCWMAAMSSLQLSHAYPLTSLAFVLVLMASGLFFQEPITLLKMLGMALIVLGITIGSQG